MQFGGYQVGAVMVPAQGGGMQRIQAILPRQLAVPQGVAQPVGQVIPPRAERQIVPPLPLAPIRWDNGDTDLELELVGAYQCPDEGLTRRLILSAATNDPVGLVAFNLQVTRFLIGNVNMFAGAQPMPLECFNPVNPTFVEFPSVRIVPGMDVTVGVSTDAAPAAKCHIWVRGYIEIMAA